MCFSGRTYVAHLDRAGDLEGIAIKASIMEARVINWLEIVIVNDLEVILRAQYAVVGRHVAKGIVLLWR